MPTAPAGSVELFVMLTTGVTGDGECRAIDGAVAPGVDGADGHREGHPDWWAFPKQCRCPDR